MEGTFSFADDCHQFVMLSIHHCVQHNGRDTARRTGPSAAAENYIVMVIS